MHLEDTFSHIASSSEKPVIILCDRGVMDGSAYSDPRVWKEVLEEMDWKEESIRDHRYEAVIHMVTAALGAEEFYD